MNTPIRMATTSTTATPASSGSVCDIWSQPTTVNRNNFVHKSLSCWAVNHAVGCEHGCLFCYVPSAATNKQAPGLSKYGVTDPDSQWGDYVLLRPWDETKFLRSLLVAENTPLGELNKDGNRAAMLATTTDPYQMIQHPDPNRRKELYNFSREVVRRSLELIRDRSTINVRILTRSPLALLDFDLFKSFGKRLVYGMSIPTLNNSLARAYEPNAPAPTQRLATLKAASAAGLHVFAAIAPTYPECSYADIKSTMEAVAGVGPITIFHEPINIRAENVARIEASATRHGVKLNSSVFATRTTWRNYARESLAMAWQIGAELGVQDRLHLWPDANLGTQTALSEVDNPYAYLRWLNQRWSRISEWPI